ncbi:hypothetical protein [Paenibacillus glycanilyticus]|uniref:hypothetical protein n=1 Tax=Paenibacillus glycanilyticus TaxID=126569 RepID=UPI0019107BF5|nr:hypothetical protein [Paenibacillus glycanilyticus]
MNNLLRWVVTLVIAITAGTWYGLHPSVPPVVFYIGLFIVFFGVSMSPVIYLTYFSKNMSRVEKFMLRSSHKPYYAVTLDLVNGRIKEAEQRISQIRHEQQRLALQISIDYEKQNFGALPRQIEKVKRPEAKLYYTGLIAVMENDWDKVEACKNQLRSKALRSVLDAEAAFKTGRYDDAKKHGDQAIADSAGMQRYILIKMLERQSRSEQRISYF